MRKELPNDDKYNRIRNRQYSIFTDPHVDEIVFNSFELPKKKTEKKGKTSNLKK